MAYLDVELNFRFNFRFKKRARTPKWWLFWTFRNICDRFIYTLDMERLSKINPQKVRLMLMTLLMTSQRDVKVGWIQEMDTYSAYLSKSQYIQSYWFSNQSDINIIYNISVITIIITTSIILANFGKYAISDCPFILYVLVKTNSWFRHCARVAQGLSYNCISSREVTNHS